MTKNYIVMKSDVVDTLVSTSTNTPLSANQGRVLDSKLTHGNAVPTAAGTAGNLYVKMPDSYPAGYVQIGTPEELVAFSNRVNAGETSLKGLLTADIDMTGVTFTPIGKDDSHKYSGTFNGYGHVISNLTINITSSYAGLFGEANGATIQNISCVECNITASSDGGVGGLVGRANSASVSKCYMVNCAVTNSARGYLGGIVGQFNGGSLSKCYVTNSNLTTSGYDIGALSGRVDFVNISDCYAYNNTISNVSRSGGALGFVNSGSISNCAIYGGTHGNKLKGSGTISTTNCYTSASTGVTSEVFHSQGFWDGTGVSGTTYLSWDFANTWGWDSTNSLPALKPVAFDIDTSLYAHNGTGWARLPESVTQEQVTGLTSALAGKQDALPVASSTGTYVLKCINGVLTWVSE